MPLEALSGRRVVLVANMKPAAMRGVKSQAMVLAATSPDGERVPARVASSGSSVASLGSRAGRDVVPGRGAGVAGGPAAQLAPRKRSP
jgi:tRNA-binding EMAP/Myf-like protein